MQPEGKLGDIKDASLADEGQRLIAWAEREMPVLRLISERFSKERPLDGLAPAGGLPLPPGPANPATPPTPFPRPPVPLPFVPSSHRRFVASSLLRSRYFLRTYVPSK